MQYAIQLNFPCEKLWPDFKMWEKSDIKICNAVVRNKHLHFVLGQRINEDILNQFNLEKWKEKNKMRKNKQVK